jgi:hypothetical protein
MVFNANALKWAVVGEAYSRGFKGNAVKFYNVRMVNTVGIGPEILGRVLKGDIHFINNAVVTYRRNLMEFYLLDGVDKFLGPV